MGAAAETAGKPRLLRGGSELKKVKNDFFQGRGGPADQLWRGFGTCARAPYAANQSLKTLFFLVFRSTSGPLSAVPPVAGAIKGTFSRTIDPKVRQNGSACGLFP